LVWVFTSRIILGFFSWTTRIRLLFSLFLLSNDGTLVPLFFLSKHNEEFSIEFPFFLFGTTHKDHCFTFFPWQRAEIGKRLHRSFFFLLVTREVRFFSSWPSSSRIKDSFNGEIFFFFLFPRTDHYYKF